MHRGGWRVFAVWVLMVSVMKWLLASIAALAVQPVVFLIWMGLPYAFTSDDFPWNQLPNMAVWVTAFALPHLLLLGIPVFFAMRRKGWLSAFRIAIAGFLIGMPFPLIIGWPRDRPGSGSWSSGYFYGPNRDFVIDGVTTIYGWLSYVQSVVIYGLHGVAGALAFYFIWKWLQGKDAISNPT
jgi:hypothetical protein